MPDDFHLSPHTSPQYILSHPLLFICLPSDRFLDSSSFFSFLSYPLLLPIPDRHLPPPASSVYPLLESKNRAVGLSRYIHFSNWELFSKVGVIKAHKQSKPPHPHLEREWKNLTEKNNAGGPSFQNARKTEKGGRSVMYIYIGIYIFTRVRNEFKT